MIAIDPGFAQRGLGCACALFARGTLMAVWFARPEHAARIAPVTLVVWECPQIDARSRTIAPTLIKLAAEGGTLAGLYAGQHAAQVERVAPSSWKGSAPKPIHHSRLWGALSDGERSLLGGASTLAQIDAAKLAGARDRWGRAGGEYYPAAFSAHNLLDAVGIGMWRLGRTGKEAL